jgi:hypothetical protein
MVGHGKHSRSEAVCSDRTSGTSDACETDTERSFLTGRAGLSLDADDHMLLADEIGLTGVRRALSGILLSTGGHSPDRW